MYPNKDPKLEFECTCTIPVRKNVWNDIIGSVVRYCPTCGERAELDYEPTEQWPAGKPMPADIKKGKEKAAARRALK